MQADERHIIRPRHPAQPSGRKNRLTGEPFGGKETKEKLWQNDLAKPSNKAFIWDAHETDSKHVAKRSNQADHASKPLASWCGQANQKRNYLGDQWKHMKASLWKLSGQAIQQSNQLGNKWKWQQSFGNHLAKPSSKAISWETNGNDSNPLATIWPSHPAKRSSGTHMKTNESKPLANQPAKASTTIIWCSLKGENPSQVIGKKIESKPLAKWSSQAIQHNHPPLFSRNKKPKKPSQVILLGD